MINEHLKYLRTDKNGTKIYADYRCPRCAGQGGRQEWTYTGFTCYECGGSGIAPKPRRIKVYTPEYEAKLKAQREKRAAKREAELRAQAEAEKQQWIEDHFPEGKIYVVLGNTYPIYQELKEAGAIFTHQTGWYFKHAQDKYPVIEMSFEESTHENVQGFMRFNGDVHEQAEAKAKALKPKSEYVGAVGEKLTVEATYSHSAWYDKYSPYTHRLERTYIHRFETSEGCILVWKTSSGINLGAGDKVLISGSVKEHSEYNGDKQTVLIRCKVKEA